MSEARFTKAPWKVKKSPFLNDYIVTSCGDGSKITHAGEEANAHLIAAAPEMYELLSVMELHASTGSLAKIYDFLDEISATLKKARGEAW